MFGPQHHEILETHERERFSSRNPMRFVWFVYFVVASRSFGGRVIFRMFVVVVRTGGGVGTVEDNAQDPGLALTQELEGLAHDPGSGKAPADHKEGPIDFVGKRGGVVGGKDGAGVYNDKIELLAPKGEGAVEFGAEKGVARVLDIAAAPEEGEVGPAVGLQGLLKGG